RGMWLISSRSRAPDPARGGAVVARGFRSTAYGQVRRTASAGAARPRSFHVLVDIVLRDMGLGIVDRSKSSLLFIVFIGCGPNVTPVMIMRARPIGGRREPTMPPRATIAWSHR